MAGILSGLFVPSQNPSASLIVTYGIFAAGFLMRPLGSGVFGWLGDTIGRARTMLISVALMALPTFLLGCLPVYAQVGILAPVLLVAVRLVQGLSVGGEFSSSVTYLVETADTGRRGLAGSFANTGSIFGMLLGSGIAALVTTVLAPGVVEAWGWRPPFLFGGVLGTVSILLRRRLPRSPHFQVHHRTRGRCSPLLEAFTTQRREMAEAIVFASTYGVLFYIPLVYLPEWLSSQTGMALGIALQINTAVTALLLVLIPVSGWIGDRVMRRTRLIGLAMLLMALTSLPLYRWLAADGVTAAIIGQVIFVLLIAVPLGSAPALFVELFPAEDRLSGYSVAYNIGLGVVGGSAPMVSAWLIDVSGSAAAPGIYLAAMAVVAAITLLAMRDRSREPLR